MTRRLLVGCIVIVAALGTAAPSLAQQKEVRLSLDQTLKMALENNLDLVAARRDPASAAERVNAQDANYDPNFTAEFSRSQTVQKPANPFQPSDSTSTNLNASYTQLFGFGGDVRATLFNRRQDAPGFNTIDPFYTSGLDLQFNMPLLRGRGTEATLLNLTLAQGSLEISREELRRQAELTLESVEGAYWNVLAAREAASVAQRSLERAKDLLALNKKKVDVGTLAPIEITQAEAEVASNEEQVIVAEADLENTEDELRRLLAVPRDDAIWNSSLVLTDRPVFTTREIDLEAAIEQALETRPELSSAEQDLRNRRLSERVARQRLKHGLDLSVNFTPFGDNDESFFNPPGPDGLPGTFDDVEIVSGNIVDAYGEIPKVENYTWSTGLTYSLPIGNKAAKADHRIAELDREKAEIALQNQEQTIRVEVRSAVRAVVSGAKRVEAASKNVELQQEKLDAEQKKFENGMSTSFEVVTFQNDLADAELSKIRAQLDYMRALTALERVKGTLLVARGLTLQP